MNNREEFTQVATIPKTAQRCKAEGIGLSAQQLRCLCKEGRLKHTMMGRNALIYWPNLLQMLESGGDATAPVPCGPGQIRPIPEHLGPAALKRGDGR